MAILEPGSDGALPEGFTEWRRGLTYTIRRLGRPSRINVTVRQRIPTGSEFTGYGHLYDRVTAIASARFVELGNPRTWRLAQAWGRFGGQIMELASASITFGLLFPEDDGEIPEGEPTATPQELTVPALATVEAQWKDYAEGRHKHVDEIYIDFDMTDPPGTASDCMLSYGEYVPALDGLDFEPSLERAESRARFHYESLASPKAPFTIERREWWTLTSPNLVAIHIYFRV